MPTVKDSKLVQARDQSGPQPRILYLAHDLDDTAIWRRVEMLRMGGAEVRIAGFRRGSGALPEPALELGQTQNGRMKQRILSVQRQRLNLRSTFRDMEAPDVILCRNLEMLALAVPLRQSLWPQDDVRLVYEVLDIHRLMVGPTFKAQMMRWIERRLCRNVDAIIVSSPGFKRAYFDAYQQAKAPVILVENKVVAQEWTTSETCTKPKARSADTPLRIGWFGILRCRFSLQCLDALTRARPGRYRVVLRGRPALDELPEFHHVVDANPDLLFEGSYSYPSDLAEIYGSVDLAWLVDRYDEGENSDWLLPNRLYESGLNRVPPVALAGTETARRLEELGIGMILNQANHKAVIEAFDGLSPDALTRLNTAQLAVPDHVWKATQEEACDLVMALADHATKAQTAKSDVPTDGVLIVIPTLNEAEHIAGVIDGLAGFLRRRKALGAATRVVVADGGSEDGTQQIVHDCITSLSEFDIQLMDNPARLQSAALNAACDRFGDGMEWLLRIDAHARYPNDYADVLLNEARQVGAASVVVSMRATGSTLMQQAIALTQNTRLGNGGSAHRMGGSGMYVDHGHHALMRLDVFRSVGGYDASFSHNEDAELDLRLTQAGHRIWLTARTQVEYLPRRSLFALFRQYINFGRGRARTVLKHRQRPRLRQFAMISVVPALALVLLVPLSPLFALPALLWFSACLLGGLVLSLSHRDPLALMAGPIAATMHMGWSIGFWQQVLTRMTSRNALGSGLGARKTPLSIDHIAVGICTYRRSTVLDTLNSLDHQILPDGTRLTIIVVDNDDHPSAQSAVEEFAESSPHKVVYRFAPSGNISIARNAALDEAEARELRVFAFIDDDELAPPDWLNALSAKLAEAEAEAVVGPVRAAYDAEAPGWMRTLRIHDTTPECDPEGRPIAGHSCNVIMDLGSAALAGRRFDLGRGVSGGEDTAFFDEVMKDGARLAFAPLAVLDEPVVAERATLSWLLKRRFRMGQTHGSLLRQRPGFAARFLPLAFAKVVYCGVLALLNLPFSARRNANLLRGALHVGTIAALTGFREIAVYGAPADKIRAG